MKLGKRGTNKVRQSGRVRVSQNWEPDNKSNKEPSRVLKWERYNKAKYSRQ